MRFEDRVALVTGGAQGIGLATCRRLGQEGARVFLVDRAEEPAIAAAEQLRLEGIDATAVVADLSKYRGAQEAAARTLNTAGRIDVLVNNVGGTIWKKPFWTYTEQEIEAEVDRSFWPTLWTCRAVVPSMVRRARGAIVNVSSNATRSVFRIPYSASKGGVNALTTALAVELADYGVRVNAVAPGTTQVMNRKTSRNLREPTEDERRWEEVFFKYMAAEGLISRAATVDEQAAVIAFVASDDAAFITGEVIDSGRIGNSILRVSGTPIPPPADDLA
jgi:dihydroxycyclohexadiene carboxylate dehydrogenase